MKQLLYIATLLLPVATTLAADNTINKRTRFMMGTYVTIQAIGPETETVAAMNAALDRMQQVDEKYSSTNSRSPIYKFNHEGRPITDPEMIALIKAAQSISRKSDGAFDITVFPLLQLWNFYGEEPQLPRQEEIEEVLPKVGYGRLQVGEDKVTGEEGVQIELGGIAKGLAVQLAVRKLKELGVASAMVDAGGDIYAYGEVQGGPWKVGINNPMGEGILAVIPANDLAVVTSGDYERYFEQDGVRYHHILDPSTGFPARGFTSVTVLSHSPILADAWSTALFALGPERAEEVAESVAQIEAVLVQRNGSISVTQGLAEGIEIVQQKTTKQNR